MKCMAGVGKGVRIERGEATLTGAVGVQQPDLSALRRTHEKGEKVTVGGGRR